MFGARATSEYQTHEKRALPVSCLFLNKSELIYLDWTLTFVRQQLIFNRNV